MTPSRWARFACGIFPENEESFIDPAIWDGLRVDIGHLTEGDDAILGIRLGAGIGIGIVAPRDGGRVAVAAEVIPAPSGGRAPIEQAEFAIRRLCQRYNVLGVAYDPDQFRRSAELLGQEGLLMREVPQRPQRLAEATSTFWRLVSGGLLSHDGDPVLRAHVLAGQTKETVAGWRIDPNPQTVGLVALVMACHEATRVKTGVPMVVSL